jgi:bacteriocin-like protein
MQSQNLMQQSSEVKEIFTELHEEELNSVVGGFGWNDIKKMGSGYVRYVSGELDGATGGAREHKDLPYRTGYRVGQVANIALQAIG